MIKGGGIDLLKDYHVDQFATGNNRLFAVLFLICGLRVRPSLIDHFYSIP